MHYIIYDSSINIFRKGKPAQAYRILGPVSI